MRLVIEIIAAILLVCCVSVSSAAYAAGKMGRGGDGLGCGASPEFYGPSFLSEFCC